MHTTTKDALSILNTNNELFANVFSHGSLSVEIYRPKGVDLQQLHTRDEVYVIISGQGTFNNGGQIHAFSTGDCMFVAAGVEHRFESFSEDFSTWVIFYGPEGGEHAQST